MKKIFVLACLAMTGMLGVFAETLSPDEALMRVANSSQVPAKVSGLATSALELKSTYTMPDGAPGVYLFSNNASWMVVSADTRAAALLGYGDGLSNGSIPPAMQYWLDFYAREMAAAPDVMFIPRVESRADRAAIAPLIKSTWDQDEPFNDLCPVINGRRCYTGCVATAIAQIAYYYKWPQQGVGSHSYTFQVGSQNYTESFNFGGTTFDYANMLDSYSGSYTHTQAQAVATLMKACGVLCDMMYTPTFSGATDISAGAGMVQYMKYSPECTMEMRDNYYAAQWEQLIYDQLTLAQPVPYGGATAKEEGHEFICDGYRDGYFHFNWGWSGMSDGYFLLSSLNPETQGSGGAASSMGFDYQQSILANLRPIKAGDKIVANMWAKSFATSSSSYNRRAGSNVRIQGYFGNNTTSPLDKVIIGLQCINADNNDIMYVGNTGITDFPSGYGFEEFVVNAKDFSVGTWYVVPAYKYNDVWAPMTYDPKTQAPMKFTVTSDKVTIEAGTPIPDPDVLSFVSTFKGWSEKELVIGQTSKFSFDVTASQDCKVTFQPLLVDANGVMKIRAGAKEVSLTAGTPGNIEFSMKFSESLQPNVTYYLVNTYIDHNSYVTIGDPVPVKVVKQAGIEAIEAEAATVVETFDLSGRPVINPTSGIYLQRMSDGTVKRVYIR